MNYIGNRASSLIYLQSFYEVLLCTRDFIRDQDYKNEEGPLSAFKGSDYRLWDKSVNNTGWGCLLLEKGGWILPGAGEWAEVTSELILECFFLLYVRNVVNGWEIGLDCLWVLLRFSDMLNVQWLAPEDSKIQNSKRGRTWQGSVLGNQGVRRPSSSSLMSGKWPSPPGAQSHPTRDKWRPSQGSFGTAVACSCVRTFLSPWFPFTASSVFSIVLIWCVFSETSVKGTLKKSC